MLFENRRLFCLFKLKTATITPVVYGVNERFISSRVQDKIRNIFSLPSRLTCDYVQLRNNDLLISCSQTITIHTKWLKWSIAAAHRSDWCKVNWIYLLSAHWIARVFVPFIVIQFLSQLEQTRLFFQFSTINGYSYILFPI